MPQMPFLIDTGAVVSLLSEHEQLQLGSITRQLRISIKQHAQIALALAEATGRAA